MQGIYCYIDKKKNQIIYIGKDSYIDQHKRHKSHIRKNNYNAQHINKILQNNIHRYEYDIILKGNIKQKILNGFEMAFIRRYNPKFNFTDGGDGALGYKHTPESIIKMSGKNHHLYGKTLSKTYKEKISSSLKGRKISNEHASKISQSMKGHIVTQETRKKISKNHANFTGKKNPKYRKDVPDAEYLFKEWKNGYTQKELSIKYKCSLPLIQRRISKYRKQNNI